MAKKNATKASISKWVESIVLTALFILLSIALNDPMSMESPFPWIWFAPVLIALRYGIWPSILSMGMLLTSHLVNNKLVLLDIEYQLFILGGFVLTITCASLQNSWSKKIIRSEEVTAYLEQRIQAIAHSYKIVSLAYQRIEETYITKPITIRSSMMELRSLVATETTPEKQKALLTRLLNVLSQQCNLEKAGIYPVHHKKLITDAITTTGQIQTPDPEDFLVETCLDRSCITYLQPKDITAGRKTNILVVAPFINAEEDIYALLIVETIPFLKLTNDNMEMVNLLLQYFLGGHAVTGAQDILMQYPDCSIEFANELMRLIHVYKRAKQDSAITVLTFLKHPRQKDYLEHIRQQKRGLDCVWETSHEDKIVLFKLMPMIGYAGIEGYRARINKMLQDDYRIQLNTDSIRFEAIFVSSIKNPVQTIHDLLVTS